MAQFENNQFKNHFTINFVVYGPFKNRENYRNEDIMFGPRGKMLRNLPSGSLRYQRYAEINFGSKSPNSNIIIILIRHNNIHATSSCSYISTSQYNHLVVMS